jgi:hypothetical protein
MDGPIRCSSLTLEREEHIKETSISISGLLVRKHIETSVRVKKHPHLVAFKRAELYFTKPSLSNAATSTL